MTWKNPILDSDETPVTDLWHRGYWAHWRSLPLSGATCQQEEDGWQQCADDLKDGTTVPCTN